MARAMSDKFKLLPKSIRSAILCARIFATSKAKIGLDEKEHILGLASLLEITALHLQEARARHAAPTAPKLEGDDLTVWRITLPSGEQCHFGTESMARAWGRGEGKVERVELKAPPVLEVVPVPSPAAPVAQEPDDRYPPCDYCGTEMDCMPWHGSGMLNGLESRHIHACDACRHKLPSVAGEQPDTARNLLTDDDMRHLRRFQEICDDHGADGHDLSKEAVKRLARAGALRSCGFGRHETTAFGDYLLGKEGEA